MSADTGKTLLTTRFSLQNGVEPQFVAWQEKLNTAIIAAPAFVSLEIASESPSTGHWIITERFCSPADATAWKSDPTRITLMQELKGLVRQGDIRDEASGAESSISAVTEVFVTDVDPKTLHGNRPWWS